MKSTKHIRLPEKEKLNLVRNLGVMLSAGIPVSEAVNSLTEESTGNQKKLLAQLAEDLGQGKTMSQSFERFPGTFDPVTLNLIAASEESGTLEETLKNLTTQIEKDIEFNAKVKGALMYPFLIFILFTGIFLVILTFVIPRISKVFSKLNVQLPLPTRVLIIISEFFLAYYPYVIAVTIGLIVLMAYLYKTRRRDFINILFSLPVISRLGIEIDITKVTKSMFLLLKSGIPITGALEFSQQIAARKVMSEALRKATETVSSGKTLSEGLSLSKDVVPSLVIRFVEAGEKSGSLEESMEQLNRQYEQQVTSTLKSVTTMLEPLMLVFIGLLVGGIMLSIIAPIYQLIGNISPR
jgi:type IV pilus assembly protein PilC